jgi:hypothetical protein
MGPTLTAVLLSKRHEIQRPKTCERFGSTRPLKTGSQPIGGGDSVVTTVDGTVEVGLGATCKRSPLWLRSPMAVESPATARPPTRPMMAILLAARMLTRSEIKSALSCMGVCSLKRVSSRAAPDRALLWLGTKQRYLVDRSFSELTCGEDRISAVRDRVIDHNAGWVTIWLKIWLTTLPFSRLGAFANQPSLHHRRVAKAHR